MWHTSISWQWTFTSCNFMNPPNIFHEYFCTLVVFIFSTSRLLVSHPLPSCCSLVPLCFVFYQNVYFFCPSYSSFLNVAEWAFGHIKSHTRWNDLQNHQTLLGHINHDVQVMVVDMVQGWIRDVNWNFGTTSCGEWLGESYTWWSFFVK